MARAQWLSDRRDLPGDGLRFVCTGEMAEAALLVAVYVIERETWATKFSQLAFHLHDHFSMIQVDARGLAAGVLRYALPLAGAF